MNQYHSQDIDEKKRYYFIFVIDRSKITPDTMKEKLSEDLGFKVSKRKFDDRFRLTTGDFEMTIRLEKHYNPAKFGKDLMLKYKDLIMEIDYSE